MNVEHCFIDSVTLRKKTHSLSVPLLSHVPNSITSQCKLVQTPLFFFLILFLKSDLSTAQKLDLIIFTTEKMVYKAQMPTMERPKGFREDLEIMVKLSHVVP